jgi:hypothetical protein
MFSLLLSLLSSRQIQAIIPDHPLISLEVNENVHSRQKFPIQEVERDELGMKVIKNQDMEVNPYNFEPNIFEVPERYIATELPKDHELYTEATYGTGGGYLYSWYEQGRNEDYSYSSNTVHYYYDWWYGFVDDLTCPSTVQPNYVTGVRLNTCLTSPSAEGQPSYSVVYTCNGKFGRKYFYHTAGCSSTYSFKNLYALKKCYGKDYSIMYFDCSVNSNVLPIPSSGSSAAVGMVEEEHAVGDMKEEEEEELGYDNTEDEMVLQTASSPAWMIHK